MCCFHSTVEKLLQTKPYTHTHTHTYILVARTLLQEVMATSSKQGNTKSKTPNDDPVITANVARPTDVDAALWEVIISLKGDTGATREYLGNVNLRLEAVEAQNEEIVASISSLQTEMQVVKSTIKTLVGGLLRAEITIERHYRIEVLFHEKQSLNFDENALFPPKPNERTQGDSFVM